jgi:lipopolysaccharide/colanic/teichoic acid biosynthesis glycosyltransferase
MGRRAEVLSAGALLALTMPLLIAIALLIKLECPGPVLESRERLGQGGRRFRMLGFRTTVHAPDQPRGARRITRLGQFLRSTRIDALPQLINVLRGEMRMADTSLFD